MSKYNFLDMKVNICEKVHPPQQNRVHILWDALYMQTQCCLVEPWYQLIGKSFQMKLVSYASHSETGYRGIADWRG